MRITILYLFSFIDDICLIQFLILYIYELNNRLTLCSSKLIENDYIRRSER